MADKKRKSIKGADIFYGGDSASQAEPAEEAQRTSTEAKKNRSKEVKKPASKEVEKSALPEAPQKVGYYLPPSLVQELEETWLRVRGHTRKKVTKSDIVRAALKKAIAEFQEGEEQSDLVSDLTSRE